VVVVVCLTLVSCALLVLAGGLKVKNPAPTSGAMRALKLPNSLALVRSLGIAEIVLGIAAAMTGASLLLALVGVAYVAFALVVGLALRAGTDIQSCGCFGQIDMAPSRLHLVVNVALATVAIIGAIVGLPTLAETLSDQPLAGVPFAVVTATAVYLMVIVMTVLPMVSPIRVVQLHNPGRIK